MRIIEAFVGEYASGKSENAVNRALCLARQGREVTLVDLDLVEPFYTLRPLKKALEEKGITVIAWETKETLGLGEAGSILKPEMRWALRRGGDIIFDVGYGVQGFKIFNLIEGALQSSQLRVYAIVNTSRPLTSTVEKVVSYLQGFGRVDGLISNSHLGDYTDQEVIQEGLQVTKEVSKVTGIPVIAASMEKSFVGMMEGEACQGFPVWPLERHMFQHPW